VKTFNKKWDAFVRATNKTSKKTLKESKTIGMSVQDVLRMFDQYAKHTWIFFDTETTGFEPKNEQLTEIAAIAVSPGSWDEEPEILGLFNEKVTLNPDILSRLNDPDSPERQSWEKAQGNKRNRLKEPQDVLKLTRYGEKGRKYVDEQEALEDFVEFIDSFDNPVLVAQNASFDMKFVSTRLVNKLSRYPVLDTLPLIQLHVIPALRTISKGEFEPFDERIQKRASDILRKIRTRFGYSASLGKVSQAYGISPEGWHNALADVKMTMQLFRSMYKTLKFAKELDIRPEHERAVMTQRRRQAWQKRKK